jgi:tetratricopeptide (TPR) repeat protein
VKKYPAIAAFLLVVLLPSCISNRPQNELSELYANLGDAYFRLEEYTQSASAYQAAFEYDKKNRSIKYNLARAFVKAGKKDEAFQLITELLEDDPQNGILLETKAFILLEKGHLEEAKSIYTQILNEVPNHANALYNSYLVANKEEEYDLALEYLEAYYNAVDRDGEGYVLLAKAAEKTEDEQQQVSYYEEAAKLGNTDAMEFLASWYNKQEEFEKAIDMYEKLMNTKDYEFKFYMQMAEIYLFNIEDFENGKKYMKLASENNQFNMAGINGRLQAGDYLWQEELKDYANSLK